MTTIPSAVLPRSQAPNHQAQALLIPRPDGKPAPTPWIVVGGGKGGVGKTLVAVNLALQTVRAGCRTLLVDLDPGLGNVDVQMRLAPKHTIDDVVDGKCSPAEAIVTGPGGVAVLAGRSGATQLASGDLERIHRTLDAVARAARGYDLVVCDTGAGIGPAVVETLRRAKLVVAVTTPDPTAVTDCYALCKILAARGISEPTLVVNRVRSRDEALRTAARLTSVCEKFLSTKPSLLGWLRSDPLVELSVLDQRPFALAGIGPAIEDLRAVTAAALSALPGLRRSLPTRGTSEASIGSSSQPTGSGRPNQKP